jgi:RNA polymerase sigma-70 factor (ECF subfamily)
LAIGGQRREVGVREPQEGPASRPDSSRHEPLPRTLQDVYARHSGFVWRIALRMGIPEHAVEDVMHEVFLVVNRRLREYDGRVSMTTWLYHQTRGVVSNYQRGRRRERQRIALVDPKPAPAPDPELEAGRAEAADFVQRFVDRLDPDKREVFVLADLEGLSVPEVAEALGIKLNTAYSRLRAARERFAQAVQRMRAAESGRSGRSHVG